MDTVDTGGGRGAILLAVCRGKVSEGINFKDKHGRCVVLTGIPYPCLAELTVELQKQAFDDLNISGLTGRVWYEQDAIRAVNQALGRVISGKFDFGFVPLL